MQPLSADVVVVAVAPVVVVAVAPVVVFAVVPVIVVAVAPVVVIAVAPAGKFETEVFYYLNKFVIVSVIVQERILTRQQKKLETKKYNYAVF